MQISQYFRRGSWAVVDQAVVSGGAFLLNILLARTLSSDDYGLFAVLFGVMLTLQLFISTLLIYPLSVSIAGDNPQNHRGLIGGTLTLSFGMSFVLVVPLAILIIVIGRAEVLAPAVAAFVAWQGQETVRRAMLAAFRHRAAILGDTVSYLGQAAITVILSYSALLNLSAAFYAMAATSLGALIIQSWQLRVGVMGRVDLMRLVSRFRKLGGLWALGNGLLSQLRVQILPWALAVMWGPAAAAGFQAAVNVVNLSNPLTITLGNIIPQAAAQVRSEGLEHSWSAAKAYAYMAAPPILGYALLLVSAPGFVLTLLYGSASEYAALQTVVALLTIAAVIGYATDVIIGFLHGVVEVRRAFLINLAGGLATALLALPVVWYAGLIGSCWVVIAANVVRIGAGHVLLRRLRRGTILHGSHRSGNAMLSRRVKGGI